MKRPSLKPAGAIKPPDLTALPLKVEMAALDKQVSLAERLDEFRLWVASGECKIRDRSGRLISLKLNGLQDRVLARMQVRANAGRPVRIIILKARKGGCSTLIQALFYFLTKVTPHWFSETVAHTGESTREIFAITKRIRRNDPDRPPRERPPSRREIAFESIDSKFITETGGGHFVGSGSTINALHLSELAKWKGAPQVVEDQLASLRNAVPDDPNTLIAIESTSNRADVSGHFERLWRSAVGATIDYEPVFSAWFDEESYRVAPPAEGIGELGEYEADLREKYALDDAQITWLRRKTADLGEMLRKQEFPSTPEEAFQVATGKIFPMLRRDKHDRQIDDLAGWELYRGIDWGGAHPFVCCWVAHRPGEPAFSIDAHACPNTWEQFETWKRDAHGRPHLLGDDACFVRGTLIKTGRGDIPIERVGVGDSIWTDVGPRWCSASGRTSAHSNVLRLRLDDGTALVGTGNHPVFLADGRLSRLDALRYGDKILKCKSHTASEYSELASAGISNVDGNSFIELFGPRRTGQYRAAGTFITGTEIRPTTRSRISNLSLLPSMQPDIRSRPIAAGPCLGNLLTERRIREGWPPGIVLLPGANGTFCTPGGPASDSTGRARCASAKDVGINISRPRSTSHIARSSANRHTGGGWAWMTLFANAAPAVEHSKSIATPALNRARVNVRGVVAVEDAGQDSVYNLTVSGAHRYFANGVLVHNCDAVRYCVMEWLLSGWVHVYRELFIRDSALRGLSLLNIAETIKRMGAPLAEEYVGTVADRSQPSNINLLNQRGVACVSHRRPATVRLNELEDGIAYLHALMVADVPLMDFEPEPLEVEQIMAERLAYGHQYGLDLETRLEIHRAKRAQSRAEGPEAAALHPQLGPCY